MRVEQLTFTRFLAAISVVIFHYGKGSFLFNNKYVSFIFQQGNVCVSYFFILSGFVMIVAYENKSSVNFGEYIKNRLARIYPVYLLAIFLKLAIGLFQNINISDLFLNVLMIQSWAPNKALTINGPGWSLSVELFFYVTFPFLINRIYPKLKLEMNAIWIISFWLVSQIIFHLNAYGFLELPFYTFKNISYHPIMHLNEFLVGNLAGLIFMKKQINDQRNYLPIILLLIASLILLFKFRMGLMFHNGFLAIIFVPLILYLSLSKDIITKAISGKGFIFLGEISFSIYILQNPVWTIFSDYRMKKYFGLHKEFDFTSSFLIRLFILIALSSLIYIYFERPLRNKIKNLRPIGHGQ